MKTRFLLTTAVVIVGAAAAAVVLWPTQNVSAAADPRTAVPLVSVVKVRTPDGVSRSFTGTIAARVQSDLGFRVSGKIVERLVNLGEDVKAGQPLMKIDGTDLRLALRGSATRSTPHRQYMCRPSTTRSVSLRW